MKLGMAVLELHSFQHRRQNIGTAQPDPKDLEEGYVIGDKLLVSALQADMICPDAGACVPAWCDVPGPLGVSATAFGRGCKPIDSENDKWI